MICELYTWNPSLLSCWGWNELNCGSLPPLPFFLLFVYVNVDRYKPLAASVFICYLFIYYDRDL